MSTTRSRATVSGASTKRRSALHALFAIVVASAAATTLAADTGPGIDCSKVNELGIDKQTNIGAAMIRVACGLEPAGNPNTPPTALPLAPPPGPPPTDVDVIDGPEIYPHVTQSESSVWSSDGQTIVVNYNDSAASPGNYAGISYSIDGGATFHRILPSPLGAGHGTNLGDPILVFNAALATWFAGDIVRGCGTQGLGLWTSADGMNWTVGACVHTGSMDDRPSMWVDNSPGSPFYGRMYVSWNDFAIGARLVATHSDDGVTWSTPAQLSSTFIRDVQVTGSQGSDGTVFVAAMNEGGGQFNNRTNIIYRSVDGGDTWTPITMGPAFAPPGDSLCPGSASYFARISPIWRHMGWGQPAVGPDGVVHYAYAGGGVNPGDTGDIYYTRSLDNGSTWTAPIVLNSDSADGGTQAQWMPSVSATATGHVHVYWYDRRNTTDGQNYEVWGIQSLDNGATFQPDMPVSDVLIPEPEQPDPNVQACYAGDYNYATAFGETHYATWTDGRNPIEGHYQQDVYFAAVATQTAGDFSPSANPSSLTLPQGGSATSTITVSSTGGFSGPVTLSCILSQPGLSCNFSPNPVTPPPDGSITSLLTFSASNSVPPGTGQFTVVGTDAANRSRQTSIDYEVTAAAADFSLSCSPSSFTSEGLLVFKTSACTVHSLNGFHTSVELSCAGLPSHVDCLFIPDDVTPPPNGSRGALLVLTGFFVPPGEYPFQVIGQGGGRTHVAAMDLIIRH